MQSVLSVAAFGEVASSHQPYLRSELFRSAGAPRPSMGEDMAHWRLGSEDNSEDHAEQDYENVIAPHLLRGPQPVQQPQVEAKPVIPQCQDGWQQFQAKCYYFSTKEGSWTLANSICDSLGAQLVVTNKSNTKEQEFLVNGNQLSYWIGLRWYEDKGWKWVDGKSQPNTTWIKGTGRCAYVTGQSRRFLQTQSCTVFSRYICEK
ncbi:hypothetical protein lerEdw1_006097 [Lerista edwardsae]|nr:hypothetical protein lerEdw1_006097 [Lerista edwardsae]